VATAPDHTLGELLTATTSEVDRLAAEVAALRRENDRLDRKRRKHKRRLAQLQGAGEQ
jgi:cell division protein FtsB